MLLIGLMTRNGILIVDFANQLRAQGLEVRDAVISGAGQRLRPILMTVLTVLGALPLALATGAWAESQFAIGVVVIGGLLLSTGLTLFLTPVLYYRLARFTRPVNAIHQHPTTRRVDACCILNQNRSASGCAICCRNAES